MMMSQTTVLPTTTATSSSKNNNLVAATVYRAALSGIENRFQELKERHGLESVTLLEKTQESLIKHLDRIVQPIHNDDNDYNDYNELLRRNDEEQEDDEEEEEELDDDEEDVDEDEEDLEELIDDDAVQRVTKIRDEVRKASEQLAKYRDSVTMKAMELADKEIRTSTNPPAFGEMVLDLVELRENFATTKTNDNNGGDNTLKQNLTQLTNDLMTMEFETTAQTLQETIDTVDNDYQQQHDDEQPLSQTERAIRSRTNEGTSSHETAKVSVDPLERLASFLG